MAAPLDEAADRALMIGDPTRFIVTVQVRARAHRPVPTGPPLVLTACPVRLGPRVARAQAALRLHDGAPCAEAEAIPVRVPTEIQAAFEAERPFWRAYPEETE
ncbi:MAG: hypothetical protein J7452_09620 [Thermoflexus sp.]|jgi:acyl-coenzyme A thioesterase PaaI-like protein|nr:hypothetical protein [Thermoflexus sp.]